MRRKLINKGFSGYSLRFTTGKNSGKIDKNSFAPQNDPGARCLWALAETGLENSPILEGNKLFCRAHGTYQFHGLENSPILPTGIDRQVKVNKKKKHPARSKARCFY